MWYADYKLVPRHRNTSTLKLKKEKTYDYFYVCAVILKLPFENMTFPI